MCSMEKIEVGDQVAVESGSCEFEGTVANLPTRKRRDYGVRCTQILRAPPFVSLYQPSPTMEVGQVYSVQRKWIKSRKKQPV